MANQKDTADPALPVVRYFNPVYDSYPEAFPPNMLSNAGFRPLNDDVNPFFDPFPHLPKEN
jgi:hypothetical protein